MFSNSSTEASKFYTGTARILAFVFDGLLIGLVMFVLAIAFSTQRTTSHIVNLLDFLIPSAVFLYRPVMHSLYGQTVGKMIMGVRVVTKDEKQVAFHQAILRETGILAISVFHLCLDVLAATGFIREQPFRVVENDFVMVPTIMLYLLWSLVAFFTVLIDVKHRGIYDYIAGTVVVKTDLFS